MAAPVKVKVAPAHIGLGLANAETEVGLPEDTVMVFIEEGALGHSPLLTIA